MSVRKVGERGFSDFLVCQRKGDKTKAVDKDARFTTKGGKSWFGYKAHVGMNEG